MSKLTDAELIEELKERFQMNQRTMGEMESMNKKLSDLNHKLETSEALKSHFLSNIKNEINNPLASILGLSSNLLNLKDLTLEKIRNTADLIHSEAFNLDFQLRNIFIAAEIEAGEAYPEPMRVDVNEVVEGVIRSFYHRIEKKRVNVEFKSTFKEENESNFFPTDSESLGLVVSNLLSNAIEFSDYDGTVKINMTEEEGQLIITIADFGIGIPEEKKKLIFDRFEQLDKGTTKAHLGHGLGLSVVKGLLDLLNGSIHVDSDLDEGSTFSVIIPPAAEVDMEGMATDGNEFLFNADETF